MKVNGKSWAKIVSATVDFGGKKTSRKKKMFDSLYGFLLELLGIAGENAGENYGW